MMRPHLLLALSLALLTSTAVAQATVPFHSTSNLSYTSRTFDPGTGLIHVTGTVVQNGAFGLILGIDSYLIDPRTGKLVGTGKRYSPDGSTYDLEFKGQFVNATDAVGTFTTSNGTGRLALLHTTGTWASNQWSSGLGSLSVAAGTTVIKN